MALRWGEPSAISNSTIVSPQAKNLIVGQTRIVREAVRCFVSAQLGEV